MDERARDGDPPPQGVQKEHDERNSEQARLLRAAAQRRQHAAHVDSLLSRTRRKDDQKPAEGEQPESTRPGEGSNR